MLDKKYLAHVLNVIYKDWFIKNPIHSGKIRAIIKFFLTTIYRFKCS